MNYALNELLDIPAVQALLDSLDEINKLPSAILDIEGNILTATSWQDICTKFHRQNHDTEKKCRESDSSIRVTVDKVVSHVVFPCPMGLIDAAAPIIVEGHHLGNVFIGQLLFEPPDEAFFIAQARRYDFDESDYVEALRKVPICSEEHLRINLKFIASFIQILAEEGFKNKRQLEAERVLHENEKKLKGIFETSEAGIIVVSPLGVITFANRRMTSMFGLPLEELVGSNYIDFVHDSEKQHGITCMQQITKGEKASIELIRHYIRKDGSDFWGNITGTRFENFEGGMRDQVIVISDISERKRAEDEKKMLEQQLLQAQKLESLGVLAGGIAHDFNNILTVISGNAYLAKMKPGAADDHLTVIEAAVDRAAGLCQQMMAYAGKAPVSCTNIDLGLLVDEMVTLLKATIPQNAALIYERPANSIHISGDASQISQIVMNLIINASEAIGIAQGKIEVKLNELEITSDQPVIDHNGNYIRPYTYASLEVTDNGGGMDEETQKKIFEPFYTTKFVGRGLGMSTVLGIVASHKGAIKLKSRVSQGTSFKVFFPLEPADSDATAAQTMTPTSAEQPMHGVLLLVEDEEQVLTIANKMLSRLGFTIIEASNGIEALEAYQKHSAEIKLVITDIGMPLMDGHELIQKLKLVNPALPIIVTSGFSEQMIISRTPSSDIAGIISKPFHLSQFQEVLKKFSDNPSSPA